MEEQEPRGIWRAALDYFGYWLRVWLFAFRRTWEFLVPPFHRRMLVPAIVFVAAVLVLRRLGEDEVANDQVLWTLAVVGSLVAVSAVVFTGVFVTNLAYAPAEIDKEQRNRIRELSQKPVLNLAVRTIRNWVYIAVTNKGETDYFEAKVLEAVGDDDMVTPWAMKWRQEKEERRSILKGDTWLLEVGEATGTGCYDDDGRHAWCLVYHLLSTTATEIESGMWVEHYYGENDEIQDPTPKEELEVRLGLHVEVRGVQHSAVGEGWLSLGYYPDGSPIATIDSEPTQLDDDKADLQPQ